MHGRIPAWCGALLLSAACGGGGEIRAAEAGEGAAPRVPTELPPLPDVLVVCVDGLGPLDIAALARAEGLAPPAATPAFDHLVGEGIVYGDAYAPSPWAGEALTGLLTGNVPGAGSVESWSPALAELLRHAGYATALVVAADLHLPRRSTPLPPGDDEVAGFGAILRPAGADGPGGAAASAVITAAAEWIAGERGPVFLVCTVADPAPPHHLYPGFAPEGLADDADRVAPDAATRVPSGLSHAELVRRAPEFDGADLERLRGLHASEVGAADHVFGRLAQILVERRGDPPVLVAAGLRRAALGEDGRVGLVPSLAPEDLRVPLIVRFPAAFAGRERPIGVVRAPASLVDLGPTLLDALGYTPRFDIDGRSLFPGAEREEQRSLVARTARGIRGSTTIVGATARSNIEGPGAPSEATFVRGPAGWEPR